MHAIFPCVKFSRGGYGSCILEHGISELSGQQTDLSLHYKKGGCRTSESVTLTEPDTMREQINATSSGVERGGNAETAEQQETRSGTNASNGYRHQRTLSIRPARASYRASARSQADGQQGALARSYQVARLSNASCKAYRGQQATVGVVAIGGFIFPRRGLDPSGQAKIYPRVIFPHLHLGDIPSLNMKARLLGIVPSYTQGEKTADVTQGLHGTHKLRHVSLAQCSHIKPEIPQQAFLPRREPSVCKCCYAEGRRGAGRYPHTPQAARPQALCRFRQTQVSTSSGQA